MKTKNGWQGDCMRVRRKKKAKVRLRYEVRFLRSEWRFVAEDGTELYSHELKPWAISRATVQLRNAWKFLRVRSELTIKLKNGDIQDKRTYGDDPREIKG